jgi:hypothetical protein
MFSLRRAGRESDLERRLRSQRPEARRELVEAVAARVKGGEPARGAFGRLGLGLAATGLMVIVFASFGGVGYASSAASQVARKLESVVRSKPAAHVTRQVSAAQAQYGPFKPPAKKKVKGSHKTVTSQKAKAGGTIGATKTKGKGPGLPFTGMTLWVPSLLGGALFALGLALRRLGRRRTAS